MSNIGVQDVNTRRITKNSLVLFVRMFVLMIINLYVVRVLMNRLGVEDFGIFNAVAGVVLTLSCVSSVLLVSTQRFYSYAQGKGNEKEISRIFSTSVNINVGLSLVVVLVFEILGMWFLNNHMQIPADRIAVANWLFQFSLFSFVGSILQIPFSSMIIANEDMHWYAIISTVECLLKLVVALLIGTVAIDRLQFYGGGLLLVAVIVLIMYAVRAVTKYEECRYKKVNDKTYYGRLLSFSGWTFFGSIANVGLIQGNAILLNIFFGPIINACFGVAMQIYNAFMSLCNSVIVALRPSMIRAYAEGNHNYLQTLFSTANKGLYYALLMVGLPVFVQMPLILNTWLGNNDVRMVAFGRLIMVYIVIIALNNPITIIMQAMGRVREYHLLVESITLLSLPLSYVMFRYTDNPDSVFFSMITLAVAAHIVRVICLKRYYSNFSVGGYMIDFLFKALIVTAIVAMTEYVVSDICDNVWLNFIVSVLFSAVSVPLLAYSVGMNRNEKTALVKHITHFIRRR